MRALMSSEGGSVGPSGGELPRYHPNPPEDVRAVLSGPMVPLCCHDDCYNDARGFNGEDCGHHEERA